MGHRSVECSLGEALTRASARMDRVFVESVGDVEGLRQVEFVLLQLIATNPGTNQKGLTEAIGLSAPQMSLALDRLLKRGLVERLHSSTDGRFRCIQLTRPGQELAQRSRTNLLRGERHALADLSQAERDFLFELLVRIVAGGADMHTVSRSARSQSDTHALDAPLQCPALVSKTSKFHQPHMSPSLS